ncbi:MAG: HEAT repeat domain-containing protein [Pirellulales bacterium]|nr:HEAT repeat domain-containing protein [Pirellulales bacterium]
MVVLSGTPAFLSAAPPQSGAVPRPPVKVRALRPSVPETPAAKAAQGQRRELRPEELVALLGHDSFDIRQRASAALSKLGSAAKPALLAGLESDDAEVRSRCRRVLAVVLEVDHREQLEAFAADREGKLKVDLPGWQRFKQLAGEDRGARSLFAEMHRYEPYLLEAVDDSSGAAQEMFLARCEQIQRGMIDPDPRVRQQATLGTVAALYFAASNPSLPVSDEVISYLHNFSYQPSFQQAMQQSAKRNDAYALRQVVGAWVSREGTASSYQNYMLALRYDLEEALPPALAALEQTEASSPVVQYALLVTGRFGDTSHLPIIEAHLDDTQICGVLQDGKGQFPMELRDLALAVAVHLAAQDHAEFGFSSVRRNHQMLFVLNTVGFHSAADRDAALAKWRAWRQSHRGETPISTSSAR